MAVSIYAIKMFMFQDQLGYDDAERDKLLQVLTIIPILIHSCLDGINQGR